jgi:hypothetical protein
MAIQLRFADCTSRFLSYCDGKQSSQRQQNPKSSVSLVTAETHRRPMNYIRHLCHIIATLGENKHFP